MLSAAHPRPVQSVVQIADDFKLLEARIKASSYSQEEFTGAMDAVRSVAAKTASPLKETATLFLRINDSTRTLGLSQQEVADTTQVVAQTMRISGATAEESSGALLQFGQALAAGVLRGDEFNSVMDQAPRLSRALTIRGIDWPSFYTNTRRSGIRCQIERCK